MDESPERCLGCGRSEELQGVALTVGRKTFHLFYLCGKCANVDLGKLIEIIKGYSEASSSGKRTSRKETT